MCDQDEDRNGASVLISKVIAVNGETVVEFSRVSFYFKWINMMTHNIARASPYYYKLLLCTVNYYRKLAPSLSYTIGNIVQAIVSES